ncbi:MAG: hypothetical protein L3J91_03495 [Thermoplasmata archaeon]|nr:hypothetical protein [Thermoplasmata archaeon]
MAPPRPSRVIGLGLLVLTLVVSSAFLLGAPAASARPTPASHSGALSSLPTTTFVSAPPTGAKGPDDVTELAVDGLDHGRAVVWTAFQNGINPDGTPGSTGGPTQSTVAGYDRATGALVRTINVTGKVDGLTADTGMGTLIATVNEDDNSAFNLIYPALGAVAVYAYSPSPAVHGVGGTDSVAVIDGQIYVAHSNPNDTTQTTDYLVTLHRATLVAQLTPVFFDDSTAVNAVTGASVTLALTDPDTNFAMPRMSPRFGGDLATVSQGDGQIIFASHLAGTPSLSVLNLSDNVSGNVPPIDGLAVATCGDGTLYVVDAGAGTITALDTKGLPAGTVFVGEPSDNGNPLVGTLNLNTGNITPFSNHFVSPKGLLFLPDHCHADPDHHHGDDGWNWGAWGERARNG